MKREETGETIKDRMFCCLLIPLKRKKATQDKEEERRSETEEAKCTRASKSEANPTRWRPLL